jgi:uncharacterized protein (DUF1684 family)
MSVMCDVSDARTYVDELEARRWSKDAYFRSNPASPLTPKQREVFTRLPYFPVDPSLRIVGELVPDASEETIEMQTTGGGVQRYRRAGALTFEVSGQPAQITLYDAGDDGFFVPFRDATSGRETYGAGRYLEAEAQSDGLVVVDFNEAYNPYCAYNARWTCPIPPSANWLQVPIRAGERSFTGIER